MSPRYIRVFCSVIPLLSRPLITLINITDASIISIDVSTSLRAARGMNEPDETLHSSYYVLPRNRNVDK